MGISERLKEERERLGHKSQAAFAAVVGCHYKSQANYETGKRYPDAAYLSAIAAAGADVLYILTGERSGAASALTADERLLLDRYRESARPLRDAALRVLLGATSGENGGTTQNFHSEVGQVAAGDIVNMGRRREK